MAQLVSIVFTPPDGERRPVDRYTRVPVGQAILVVDQGISGDLKGGSDQRQLNVMVAEVLDQLRVEGFKASPGQLGEQLVVAGIDPAAMTTGTRVRIGGTAVIEVTLPRTGCDRFERIHGRPKTAVSGRLGVMARVIVGGEIRVGDEVELLATESHATAS